MNPQKTMKYCKNWIEDYIEHDPVVKVTHLDSMPRVKYIVCFDCMVETAVLLFD